MTKSPPSSLLPYPHPSPPQPHPSHPKSIQTALFITNSTFFTTCCHFKTKRCFRKIFRRADGGHIGNKWWPPWKRHTIFISLHLYCVYSNAYYPILRFFLSVVIFKTENMHLNRQSQCWLYTTGKKYGIFFISAIFFLFYGAYRVFLYLIYIPTSRYYFWGVNSHSISKWTAKVQKQLFWSFFFIRRWLEFLLFHCQIAAISVGVFIRESMPSIIVYLPPRLVRSAGY